MAYNALQLIQQACGEMGLPQPSTVVGNPAGDATQQLALLNALGNELVTEYEWQALTKQYIFTVVSTTVTADTTSGSATLANVTPIAGIDTTYQISGLGLNQATYVSALPGGTSLTLSQPATSTNPGATYTLGKVKYAMPSDYWRQIDRTHWDKSKHWEMLGPETAQQWEWLISGYISTGPRVRYRILGNYFQIWPLISTADSLGFEYLSNGWVTDAVTTPGTTVYQSLVKKDTDTFVFPDRLLIDGLKRKYFEVKGFDPTAFQRDYQRQLDIAKAADAGSRTLSMAPRVSNVLINWNQIPDSGYGS